MYLQLLRHNVKNITQCVSVNENITITTFGLCSVSYTFSLNYKYNTTGNVTLFDLIDNWHILFNLLLPRSF